MVHRHVRPVPSATMPHATSKTPHTTRPHVLPPARRRAVQRRLLEWYDAHAEPFPWREARDPYAALVAAVCAQQTQIARVLEIYARWMAAFPTLPDLAKADRASVLQTWGRAGYPRRAVGLHETARRDPEALLALPGIGPFTAAIVRTFGFEEDAPAVDTNIVRVVGRLVFGDLQPARDTPRAEIDAATAALFPAGAGARWNPALMDYGARVCTPRPKCEACVVSSMCAARPRFAAGEVAEPVRAQGAFEGSERQARGRVMQVLRDAASNAEGMPVSLGVLTKRVGATTAEERARVRMLLGRLADEGLAWTDGRRAGLGQRPT